MRPVNRGPIPEDSEGEKIEVAKYQKFRGYLIKRLGQYCSYCGMRLDTSLAIEHVRPKSRNPAQELEWENLLLACTNCNSTKGKKAIQLASYFWPHLDNTYLVLKYSADGLINLNPSLSKPDQKKAQNTITLTGLDRTPDHRDTEASDRRWSNRFETWGMAQRAKSRLEQKDSAEMREQIIETAVSKGYWSIWYTVFAEDPDICERLQNAFPGTAKQCFKNNQPITRP